MANRNIPIDDDMNETEHVMGTESTGNGEQVDDLQQHIAELELENQTLREQKLRAVADLENFRRRMQQELANSVTYGNERLLKDLLPLIDDFDRSVESGEKSRNFESFFEGIGLIRSKMHKLLDDLGVTKIEAMGQEFSVDLHEALMRQPSEAPENTVIGELEPGYMYKERVLRHAKVIVSAGE